MNYVVFIIGVLSGAAGAAWGLWSYTRREIHENLRLRQNANIAFGNGYDQGYLAGVAQERGRSFMKTIEGPHKEGRA